MRVNEPGVTLRAAWALRSDRRNPGQLRRFIPPARVGYADVACYIDGVLRAIGSQGDFSRWRHELDADGRLQHPSLQDVNWSLELNPETLSARLDDAGNVVEVFPAPRSNLRELGIRQLEPSLVGVYTFEGEGDCARGTNPHLLVSTHGVLPYEYSPESCSTGQVTVTGYAQTCEDYGPDE